MAGAPFICCCFRLIIMKKSFLIGAVIVLVVVAVLGRRWWLKSTDEVAVLAAVPAPAAVIPDSTVVELAGRVSAGGDEPVLARTAGRLRTVYFENGQYVRRGEVIAKLSNFTFVLAPHAGFMSGRRVATGQYVGRTTVVGSISKRSYLLVPVVLPPDLLAGLQPGDSVRVWAAARPTRVVTGVAQPTAAGLEIRLPTRAPLRIGEEARFQLHRSAPMAAN
jgi:multidrug efflux pump subunit AcrA (membrane-fusion protein)